MLIWKVPRKWYDSLENKALKSFREKGHYLTTRYFYAPIYNSIPEPGSVVVYRYRRGNTQLCEPVARYSEKSDIWG